MATTVNGISFHLIDDIDTLICKLENIRHAYYIDNEPCNIDKVESDIEALQKAFEANDTATMQRYLNEYAPLFKRYR